MGAELARKIECTAAKPEGWLDADHTKGEVEVESIDLIVRTVTLVNQILEEHDMPASRMKREAYEDILRKSITSSVRLGMVTSAQIQHTLFASQLSSFAE